MTWLRISVVVVLILFSCVSGFAQAGVNATLSGTVNDSTGALIPGVEVTARNTETGVVSTAITNEAGTYRFASHSRDRMKRAPRCLVFNFRSSC
jgi:hypothetical protein